MTGVEARSLAREYLFAAARKVAITRYHRDCLMSILQTWPTDEIALQAHFEGVFYAGSAASEKIASAIAILIGIEPGDTRRVVRQLKEVDATSALAGELERWRYARADGKVIVDEGEDLRNAATHEFQEKRHAAPGDWFYSVRDSKGDGAWRSGRVDEFPSTYADHIDALEAIIERVADQWDALLDPPQTARPERPSE
jgi:hypothetical protein